ncbi:MAG TPA: hypothetical protein VMT86_10030 [Bryobacteraceae bacterium]|nr:hypothetical protein [Bryobacteraceae bacterium]
MKTLNTITLTAAALALLGGSGLYAQTQALAQIPFEFSVQDTTMPAGKYIMSQVSASHELIEVRNVETGQAAMVLAPSGLRKPEGSPDKDVVVFHRAGDRYFLAGVRTTWMQCGVAPSKLQRELESEYGGPGAAAIIPILSVR